MKHLGTLIVGLGLGLFVAAAAHAEIISGFGGATDAVVPPPTAPDWYVATGHGTFGIAGAFSGGRFSDPSSVAITVSYQDSHSVKDGFVCRLAQGGDVHVSLSTLTLKVGNGDSCWRVIDHAPIYNAGRSMEFDVVYADDTVSGVVTTRFVGTDVNLLDGDGNVVRNQTVQGTIVP